MASTSGIINTQLTGVQDPNIMTAAAGSTPSAQSSTTVPQTTVTDTASSSLTPIPAAGSTSATGYNASQLSNPTQWDVTADQTVAGQLNKILDPNSPIIQQALSQGQQLANERGLSNSSMAQTAAQSAAYQAAVPIANADAQTNAKAAGYNADETNQFGIKNADYLNTASQFSANAANQKSIAQMQSDTQINLQKLDSATRENLATIEANYKTLMQSNQSASDLFRQVTQNITNIQMSNQMDGAAKQQAVDNQMKLLQNGMGVNGAISNLNLSGLLDFSGVSGAPATPPVDQSVFQSAAQSYGNPNMSPEASSIWPAYARTYGGS
jgi:hypothetical protein